MCWLTTNKLHYTGVWCVCVCGCVCGCVGADVDVCVCVNIKIIIIIIIIIIQESLSTKESSVPVSKTSKLCIRKGGRGTKLQQQQQSREEGDRVVNISLPSGGKPFSKLCDTDRVRRVKLTSERIIRVSVYCSTNYKFQIQCVK